MNEAQVTIAKQIIETSSKKSRPEVYPLSSAKSELTVDHMPVNVIKNMYGRYQAKVVIDDASYLVDIKGALDIDNLPTEGKLVQLECAETTPWEIPNTNPPRKGTIEKGEKKAYIVV